MNINDAHLNQNYLKYVFSDNSGIIFYNEVSGETIALNLSIKAFENFLLSGDLSPDWDIELIEQLRKIVNFDLTPSMQLYNDIAK